MSAAEYHFRLFVAGDEANSRLAERNLRALCGEHLPNRHRIEVVNVLEDSEAALAAHVMVVPAVVVTAPRPVTLFGTLADKNAVLAALAL